MAVFCGQCNLEFETPELELAHICEVTGVAPTELESMGPNWDTIALKAIERGEPESTPAKTKKAQDDVKAKKAEKQA